MQINLRRSQRQAFTLIEMLITIGIVALLVALIMPAIQNARESARRTQCRNNFKSLGLALHSYHDLCNRFPSGFVLNTDGVYLGWSWSVMLLPYLDASPVYSRFDFRSGLQHAYASSNTHFRHWAYQCPSDCASDFLAHAAIVTTNVVDEVVTVGMTDAREVFARSNYFGVAGYLQVSAGGINPDANPSPASAKIHVNAGSLGNRGTDPVPGHRYLDPKNFQGIFGQNSNVRIKDVEDGISNTVIVAERYTPKDSSLGSIGHGTWLGVPDCTTAAGLAMSLGDTSVRLNSGYRSRAQTTGFGSSHTGGAHFLMGDGSSRFISEGINVELYRNLSTIADGNVISNF